MFTFELVSISGVKFSESVYEVILPTKDGYIGVFPHHMPLISLIEPGVVKIRRRKEVRDDQMEQFAVNAGVVEIDEDLVRILVDEADHSSEIVHEEAEKALQLAQKRQAEAKSKIELEKAESLLNISKARLQIAQLKRRKQR